MVYGLVYDQNSGQVPPPPPSDAVYEPDLRLGSGYRQPAVCSCEGLCLQLVLSGVWGLLVDTTSEGGAPYYYPPLVKEEG